MNRLIKLPIIFGVLFALAQVIPEWFYGGFTGISLRKAVIGLIIGCLLGLLLVLVNDWAVRFGAQGNSEEDFNVYLRKVIIIHAPFDKAFDLCKESLRALGRYSIKTEDRSVGKIEARTGFSFLTFGNVISCEVSRVGEQLTEIRITSRPIFRTTLIDFGSNLRNVKKMIEALSENDCQLSINPLKVTPNLLVNQDSSQTKMQNQSHHKH